MRRYLTFALRAVISLALIYLALSGVDLSTISARLREIKIEWMLAAVALAFLQLALLSERWRRIANACDAPLPLPTSFRFNLIGAFFNQVLPSTVGGDAMRIWLLARRGAGFSKATHSVLLDRFVGVLTLALLVAACLPWTLVLVRDPVGQAALLVVGMGSLSGAGLFLVMGKLQWSWLDRWTPIRHLTRMSDIARQLLFSVSHSGVMIGLSVAIHLLTASIAWCAARAVDAPLDYFQAVQLVPPVMLIATIPISVAGWGVREKSLVLAFSYASLPQANGFLISVLLGITMLIVGLVGSIAWLAGSRGNNKA